MIDPTTIRPGQRVRIQMTGVIGEFIAVATDKQSHGWAVLRLEDEPNTPLLKCEDYIAEEILA